MKAPGITYRYLWPKDVAGPTLEMIHREESLVAAAVGLERFITGIPADRILVITNVVGLCVPGAGQACTSIELEAFTAAELQFSIAVNRFVVAANVHQVLNWEGEIWVAGRGAEQNTVRLNSVWDAGALNNTLRFSLSGFVIPRANVAPF